MASLSNTLLMIPRELPSYLTVAYSLRYADIANKGNCISRVFNIVQRAFSLIKELIFYRPSLFDFQRNAEKLHRDFADINQSIATNDKPICVYFVSAHDHNGAILGNHLYYYHHYKIQGLQKHFAVAPKLVSSQAEMKAFMETIKQQYPQREIQFVDVVSHGGKSSLSIRAQGKPAITAEQLRDDLFDGCAPDATILLDACITGLGDRNIADEIARKTPGRTVLAPGPAMFFSKPVVQTKNNVPRVVSAVHGFAIFNAYTCKSFSYKEKMPSQYPYVKDESLQRDMFSIASFSVLQNSWLDAYLNEENKDHQHRVINIFDQLSEETKALVAKQVWKNNGSPLEHADTFGENFLRAHPLHSNVRSAFRSVFNELIHEVRDYPGVSCAKALLCAKNTFQAINACARNLCCRPVVASSILQRA